MTKRLCTIFVAVVMLFSVLILCANAQTDNSCGASLTWSQPDSRTLQISGTGAMTDYASALETPWYSVRDSIERILVDDGVTAIGDRAFYNFTKLVEVQLGKDVATVGSYAFRGCTMLTEVTLPASVTEVKGSAFRACSEFTKITLEGDAPTVGSYAFAEGAASITLRYYEGSTGFDVSPWTDFTAAPMHTGQWIVDTPATCTTQGSRHIDCTYCNATFTEAIPFSHNYVNGVCSVCQDVATVVSGTCGSSAAWKLDATGKLTISGTGSVSSYTSGNSPWYGYREQIRSVEVENGITSLSQGIFYGLSKLEAITIPFVGGSIKTASNSYQYPFGYIFGTSSYAGGVATEQLYYGSSTSSITSTTYYIPSSLKTVTVTGGNILHGAFYNCSSLTDLTIPDSVTRIGDSAFRYCSSLTSVTIPDSVTRIGTSAFSGCSSLTSVTIPESVTSIGWSVFSGCSSLTSVTIPDSVTHIDNYAFSGCSSLTSVTIPDSVTSIIDYAFSNCSSLTGIWVVSGNQYYCSDKYGVLFNKAMTTLIAAPGAITEYTIPDSVTRIVAGAFSGCSSLTSVTIPESVTSIGDYAFYNCSSLTSVTIPNSVTSIGDSAFYNCSSLTSVTIPDGVTSIGWCAFCECSSLTSVTIPDSVTSIGNSAFSGCSSLTSVTIPDSVTSIGWYAFADCRSLTSVTIPDSVTSIGDDAFSYCSSLRHVAYTGTQGKWQTISIGNYNSALTSATRHYETTFRNVDNCVETGVYCPVCKEFIIRTEKEGGSHSYTDISDRSCNGCSFSRTATEITITKLPEKLGYLLFEDSLDVTGGQILVTFDDGSSGTVEMTVDMVSGFDNTVVGTQTLTVTWAGAATTYTVEICATVPQKIEVVTLPEKRSYITGETLDLTGLTLAACYKDGQTATVTAADVIAMADMTTSGKKTVTVLFQGVQTTFEIYVHTRTIQTVDSSLYPRSSHNYSNNMNETKTLTVSGATRLILTFHSSSATESGYDYVYVLDGNGNQIGKYHGSFGGTVVTVPGDTVKIRLTSDGSNVKYGYAFSKIEADMVQHPAVTVPGRAPTCKEVGLTDGAVCEICGQELTQQQEIPVTDHTMAEATCTAPSTCTMCGETEGEALGHSGGIWVMVIAPTDTEKGLKARICDVCGGTETAELEIADHNYVTVVTPPTCTQDGYTTKYCTICGASETYDPVPAKGHSWSAWIRVTAPACDVEGMQKRFCNCGTWETETLAALEHLYENGKCSHCGALDDRFPTIVEQPRSVTLDSGEQAQFTVLASGNVVSYQWQYRKVYKWYNTSMEGYNTDTLTVSAKGRHNGYDYKCIITFADGTVLETTPAELTVNTTITITYQPKNQLVAKGAKGQFTVAAQGEGLKYVWEYYHPVGERWIETTMEGNTRETVMIQATAGRDGYKYRCKVTDEAGMVVYTEPATMTVLTVAEQPEDVFTKPGEKVTFTVAGSVAEGYSYQWQYYDGRWINTSLTGYNTATLTVSARLNINGRQYRCVLTGDKNSKIESEPATLHVGEKTVITAQPQSVTVEQGTKTVELTVEATNVYSYQWWYSNNGTDWYTTGNEGNKTATLTAKVKNGRMYRCVIKGLDGTENITEIATITVG